jgi:hypothetical protein
MRAGELSLTVLMMKPKTDSHGRWGLFLTGLISVCGVLVLGLWGYDRWANDVPPFRPSAVTVPSPNGYDQAAALTARLPPEPGARLRRWPDGPSSQLRAVLRPVLPTLDAIHRTFRLRWQAPLPLGMLAPRRKRVWLRPCGRYLAAASTLAARDGDVGAAMERSLDIIELAGRTARGGPILTELEAVAVNSLGLTAAEPLVPALPARAIPGALERVRRIQRAWPSWPEVLEAERISTLAEQTWIFQQVFRHPTPLHTLHFVGEMMQSAVDSPPSDIHRDLLIWLEPKRYALRSMDDYLRQAIAESKKPIRQRRDVSMPSDLLSQMAVSPYTWQERQSRLLSQVQSDLALLEVALAVRMHRVERGRPPARLAEISPRWLPAVPLQPGGQPIAYELREGQPVISYSESDGTERRVFGTLTARFR